MPNARLRAQCGRFQVADLDNVAKFGGPARRQAEQALVEEFQKSEQQDWRTWPRGAGIAVATGGRTGRRDVSPSTRLPLQRLPSTAFDHTAGLRTGWELLRKRVRLRLTSRCCAGRITSDNIPLSEPKFRPPLDPLCRLEAGPLRRAIMDA